MPHPHGAVRAVLFDMDGTLVASDGVWDGVLQELAAARGGRLPPEFFVQIIGLATVEAIAIAHRRLGLSDDEFEANVDWVRRQVLARMADEAPRWLPGARQLLGAVRSAGLATGLVTSSERAFVEAVLDPRDRACFDVIVCGDDVSAPKPSPEPYLRAAGLLDLEAADCAVVEDSAIGVASALAAGCRVIAVDGHGVHEHPAPYQVVTSLLEVDLRMLRSLDRGGPSAVQR